MGNFLLPAMVFLPMLGGVICYIIGRFSRQARDAAVLAVCTVELSLAVPLCVRAWQGSSLTFHWVGFCGMGINFSLDGFRAAYALIAALMWFMTSGLFAPVYFSHHYRNRNRYYLFTLLTLGATVGVFLSSDLYTTFIFFEIMSLTSYAWVAHDEKPAAMRAAQTYLAVAIIGGMVTLMGLFLLYHQAGTLNMDALHRMYSRSGVRRPYLPAVLIAVGFFAKAGAFPLHIWLPKAHPVAPAPASALLSGVLTKSGIFGIIAVTGALLPHDAAWGNALLIIAVITMFVGALLALFSVDLKRTLACSSMSQIGFILTGLAMAALLGHHDGLAVHGALLHMVNHSLIKLVLFMAAGAVYMHLHKLELNDIRGFGRGKPALHFAFLMGYLGIIGMPGWNGFVSKSLIHESILEYIEILQEQGASWFIYKAVEVIFLFTGGMTAAYMTKLYICIFWQKNDAATQKQFDAMGRMPLPAALALVLSGAILPVLGLFSNTLMQGLAGHMQGILHSGGPSETLNYFSPANLLGAAESLAIGAALYLMVVRRLLAVRRKDGTLEYVNRWPAWLDLENLLYRPLLETILPGILGFIAGVMDRLIDWALAVWRAVASFTVTVMDGFFDTFVTAIKAIGTFLARAMDDAIDSTALLLKNTLFGPRKKKKPLTFAGRVTLVLGSICNGAVWVLNRTVFRRKPITTNFTAVFAAVLDEADSGVRRIIWSVSFGLLLLCVGLYITFVYLLVL